MGIAFALAAVLGEAIGFGGLELGRVLAGWDDNDWRFVPLTCGFVLAYTVPHLSLRGLFSRLLRIILLPVRRGRRDALARLRPPRVLDADGLRRRAHRRHLLLLEFIVHRLIWRWKLRNAVVAMAASAGEALLFTAVVFLIGGREPGPHQAAYVVPVASRLPAPISLSYARTPFCLECDSWLDARRIGPLPLPLHEAKAAIESGQILALAGVHPYQEIASIGDVELKVHTCLECRDRGTVVLELFDCVKGGKNGKVPQLVRAGLWQYPGTALPVIEELFPPPQVLPVPEVSDSRFA